jgi:xanthine dehydrogenase accessory factor
VAETDMLCGGQVEVFLEPVAARDSACGGLFRRIGEDLRTGQGGLLITMIDPKRWEGGAIPKLFLRKSGEIFGSLPGAQAVETAVSQELKRLMGVRHLSVSEMTDDAGRGVEVLLEPVAAKSLLFVFGAGHVSMQIVPLAARVGFQVVVIDDREDFADPGRFPEAAEVRCIPFEGVMDRLAVDGASFVVIVTRGHMGDKTVLAQALMTGAGYIGMIGSRQKRGLIYQALSAQGFTQQDLDRVHSPIGIEIGAETPEEIAVSIVAELIQVRAGGLKPEH